MNLDAKPGTKVRFNNAHGYDSELEYAREYLNVYYHYTLAEMEVDRFSSRMRLEEYPKIWWNTVMFDEVESENVEEKVYFTGWLRIHYTRKLDVDKNPITEWEQESLGRAGYNTGLANPYLYTTKGRAGYEVRQPYPIYEKNPYPYPRYDLMRENPDEYKAMQAQWAKFEKIKKIIGYNESKVEIVEAKVVPV